MKKIYLTLIVVALSVTAFSQKHTITLGGGYAFAQISDFETGANGYRINGLYEFNPKERKFVHGLAVGYIHTKSTVKLILREVEMEVTNFPIYYAPKYIFGNGAFKPFVKGALGLQFSNTKLTGPLEGFVDDQDSGFYGGLGAGFMVSISEQLIVNADYEWAYSGNSLSLDRYINSIMLGFGFQF